MATITGLTAERMLAIEAASVVDGDVVGDNLILVKKDGTQINAGSVRGPQGVAGPPSSDTAVLSAIQVNDVGVANQIRAGRALLAADFTAAGLTNPNGLWNLWDMSDVSGNGRALLNKGAVGFGTGINGVAYSAAQFTGSSAKALYIADTGVNDPFRIKVGTWGCWFRTAKRDTPQALMSKWGAAGNQAFIAYILAGNVLANTWTQDGTNQLGCQGITDVADDRWHFMVCVHDGGATRLYVDGALEGEHVYMGSIFQSSAPFNLGGTNADASTAAGSPHYGRIDEAFITGNVMTEDQIRYLYCAKIPHTLAAIPSRVSLKVRRQRRGGAYVSGDFPTAPLRLYNFSGAALTDSGSNAQALTNNGAAVALVGADGRITNGFNFNGSSQTLSSTDTGLPAGTTARSFGCWFRTTADTGFPTAVSWGTTTTGDTRLGLATGNLRAMNVADALDGPFVADSRWHFAVVVEDNSAGDGVKRKLYLDGKLVDGSTTITAIVLGGASSFRVGSDPNGSSGFFPGHIDGVFLCGYAMTPDTISSLYGKGTQTMPASPKNSGDHVEAVDANNIYAIFDTLDTCHQVDIGVAP